MRYLKYLLFTLSILLNVSVCAQKGVFENDLMRRCALNKVNQLNDYISFLGDKSKDRNTRNQYIDSALNLFIGKGEPFEIWDAPYAGVRIEITSIHNKKTQSLLMKNYLNRLLNLSNSKVDVQSIDVYGINVGDLHKIDDDRYVCTVCFNQKFVGYRDGMPTYRDMTKKRVKVYISAEETIDGQEFIVLLGDVIALEY